MSFEEIWDKTRLSDKWPNKRTEVVEARIWGGPAFKQFCKQFYDAGEEHARQPEARAAQ
jgi:hypothetical protein